MLFIPYATNCERSRFPLVTVLLIVLNVVILVMQFMAGPDRTTEVALVPAHPTALGAVMSMFMHAHPFHLAGNMLFLWVFGSTLEDRMGPWLYLALYLGGGICATLGHVASAWCFQTSALEVPVVGASGAVAALVGMFAVRFYQNKVRIFYLVGIFLFIRWGTFELGALWVVGFFLGENVLFGLLDLGGIGSGVAYWAHLAGLFFGIGAGLAIGLNHEASTEYESETARAFATVNDPGDQVRSLQGRVRANPNDIQSVVWLGREHAQAGRWDEAIQIWTSGLQKLLQEPPGERLLWFLDQAPEEYLRERTSPHLQYQTALALERAQQYDRALAWLDAVAQHPEAGESAELALLRKAAVHRDGLQNAESAAREYASFLERFPESRWSAQARQSWQELQAA